MTIKIFKSMILVTVCSLLATVIIILGISFEFFNDQLEKELSHEASYVATGVESGGSNYLSHIDKNTDTRITWIDSSGKVLFDNKANKNTMGNHLNRTEVRQAIDKGEGTASRYSGTLSKKTVYYAKKLSDSTVLRVSSDQYSLVSLLLGFMQPLIVVIVIAFIIAIIVSMRLSKKIIEPIQTIDLDNPQVPENCPEVRPIVNRLSEQNRKIEFQINKLKDNEAQRREFTSNVSHELKTPLTSISGFAELIKSGMVDQEDIAHFSENIYNESQRLITLVNDIIKLSQLEDKDIVLEKEPADICAMAKAVVQRLQPAADMSNVSLSFSGEPCELVCNHRVMEELIYNLCDNAIKYNQPGGSVTVSVTEATGRVYLVVQDNGIGIPKEMQSRIFERFYRVDKSHSKEIGGTGLGLSIVKHGVACHRGDIILDSEEGCGSKFTIVFPQDINN